MIRRPPRSTLDRSSAASDVYKRQGFDTIPNYLANGLNIQLNQRVSKIDYSSSKIKVTHNGMESEADYVLVTVPLGVLKANSIQFTPILPNTKQNAIQKIGMNCVNKFLLIWKTPFWDKKNDNVILGIQSGNYRNSFQRGVLMSKKVSEKSFCS